MSLSQHWNQIYLSRPPESIPWRQPWPKENLELIATCQLEKSAPLLDMGAGASNLVDALLAEGFQDITLVDLSAQALEQTRQRLGSAASHVQFLQGDALGFLPTRQYALWHDRACFHFLIEPELREIYLQNLRASLQPKGFFSFSAFSTQGPKRCSGLPVRQYNAMIAQETLGSDFHPIDQRESMHITPGGVEQAYIHLLFQFQP